MHEKSCRAAGIRNQTADSLMHSHKKSCNDTAMLKQKMQESNNQFYSTSRAAGIWNQNARN
jgi:hypothetical protein